jgi:hypothetical protein
MYGIVGYGELYYLTSLSCLTFFLSSYFDSSNYSIISMEHFLIAPPDTPIKY